MKADLYWQQDESVAMGLRCVGFLTEMAFVQNAPALFWPTLLITVQEKIFFVQRFFIHFEPIQLESSLIKSDCAFQVYFLDCWSRGLK